jgi:EmrB/QacA subfamily drug resistance transporter
MRKWTVVAAIAIGMLMSMMDQSIVNLALPTLTRAFRSEFSVVQWIVLAYMLTVTTLMLGVARLGDMVGTKPVYLAGVILFTAASAACGIHISIAWLIGARVVQGIGAAMIAAIGAAIIAETFPPHERGKAIGIVGSVASLGIVLGPTLGGVILSALSWNWLFLINVPIGVVTVALAARFIAFVPPVGGQRFDYVGAGTLFVATVTLLLALTLGQRNGFAQPTVFALFALSSVAFAAFVAIELRTEQPMIAPSLFRSTLFTSSLVASVLSFMSVAGTLTLMPFYLQNVLGYDPRQAGLMMVVFPIALAVTSPIAGALADRHGSRVITVVGLTVSLAGYYGLSSLDASTSTLGYLARYVPLGVGLGLFISPNNSAMLDAAPPEHRGIASGLMSVARALGQTFGFATLGAFWASRVAVHAGGVSFGGATSAPSHAQVEGLHDTSFAAMFLIALALAVALFELHCERRARGVAANAS